MSCVIFALFPPPFQHQLQPRLVVSLCVQWQGHRSHLRTEGHETQQAFSVRRQMTRVLCYERRPHCHAFTLVNTVWRNWLARNWTDPLILQPDVRLNSHYNRPCKPFQSVRFWPHKWQRPPRFMRNGLTPACLLVHFIYTCNATDQIF